MINNDKKITLTDLQLLSVFLSKYNHVESFTRIAKVLQLIVTTERAVYIQPTEVLIYQQSTLVYDVLELATAIRVRIYPKQIMKICSIIDPKINDNFVSKTLYQIQLHNKNYKESLQGNFMVLSRADKKYTDTKRKQEGSFSKNSEEHTHKSKLTQQPRIRQVFLEVLDKNAERQSKMYLANKYHSETWVVSLKNAPQNVWLMNWQESSDHVRTFYSREFKVKMQDVRCKRLKNYCKIK